MSESEALKALRERVEKAEGADRELDGAIEVALRGGQLVEFQRNYTMEPDIAVRRPSANHVGGMVRDPVPHLTASLDAAISLVEKMLPGWGVLLSISAKRTVCDVHTREVGDPKGEWPGHAEAATPALALIAALLKALEARNG